jgi:2-polyprenyl-3-methyl-5-hydroxy-6-metoxy-1,4-benzoquinol methylase
MEPVWKTHLGTDVPFDPVYHENPRIEIASFINEPPGVVLDIGCGGGATGKLIKAKFPDTKVIGIELNSHAAAYARQFLDVVIGESIDTVNLAEHIGDMRVGTVLLLDVLEHIYDPWRTLLRIREWLAPGTRVLASIPNIRNLANLDQLAAGHWEYGPNGVLDVTHVRFFTRESLRALFEQTGYRVESMEPLVQPRWLDSVVARRGPGRLHTANVSIAYKDFSDLEDLYALQYVIDARVPAPASSAMAR